MQTLWQDTRYALRALLKRPGFALIAILTLGLGIGANTAIFSVVHATFFGQLPFADADRLVMLWLDNPQLGTETGTSYPNFEDTRTQSQVLADLAVLEPTHVDLTGDSELVRLQGARMMASVFPILGVEPTLGRGFLETEDWQGGGRVVVLSDALWQRRFGGEPDVLGQEILLSGEAFTVVGVMPPGFDFPEQSQLWLPMAFDDSSNNERRYIALYQVGRLKPGVSTATAQTEMDTIANRIQQEHAFMAGYGIQVQTMRNYYVGSSRTVLLVLLGAVGFVLLIACGNVASLLLAQAATRQREISIRVALGAGRGQLIRQLLTESVLLALGGGVLGMLVAVAGLRVLIALGPAVWARLPAVGVDPGMLAFTLSVSLLTGLGVGLLPAVGASRTNLSEVLRAGGRGASGSRGARRMRRALVVAEVALALVLLIGAGLLLKSLDRLLGIDSGLRADGVLTVELPIDRRAYPQRAQRSALVRQINERVAALPGVEHVAAISSVLLEERNLWSTNVTIEGRDDPPPELRVNVAVDAVTPGLFQTLGITLLAGRDIAAHDVPPSDNPDMPLVAVINEVMARRYWGDAASAVGQRFTFGDQDDPGKWRTVIGVVADARRTAQEKEARPSCYLAHAQVPLSNMTLVVKSATPGSLAEPVRQAVWKIDPNQPIAAIGPLDEAMAGRLSTRRFQTWLFGAFSLLALFLALVGIYGVISHTVSESRREIGVRMALGAQRFDVFRQVLGQTLALAGAGLILGIAASLVLTRALSSLLFSTSALDPWVFSAVAVLIVAVALAAGFLPAHWATRVHPTEVLRYE